MLHLPLLTRVKEQEGDRLLTLDCMHEMKGKSTNRSIDKSSALSTENFKAIGSHAVIQLSIEIHILNLNVLKQAFVVRNSTGCGMRIGYYYCLLL